MCILKIPLSFEKSYRKGHNFKQKLKDLQHFAPSIVWIS